MERPGFSVTAKNARHFATWRVGRGQRKLGERRLAGGDFGAVEPRAARVAHRAAHEPAGEKPRRPVFVQQRGADLVADVAVHARLADHREGEPAAARAARRGPHGGLIRQEMLELDRLYRAAVGAVDVRRLDHTRRLTCWKSAIAATSARAGMTRLVIGVARALCLVSSPACGAMS